MGSLHCPSQYLQVTKTHTWCCQSLNSEIAPCLLQNDVRFIPAITLALVIRYQPLFPASSFFVFSFSLQAQMGFY